jgi:hypothetical protein
MRGLGAIGAKGVRGVGVRRREGATPLKSEFTTRSPQLGFFEKARPDIWIAGNWAADQCGWLGRDCRRGASRRSRSGSSKLPPFGPGLDVVDFVAWDLGRLGDRPEVLDEVGPLPLLQQRRPAFPSAIVLESMGP